MTNAIRKKIAYWMARITIFASMGTSGMLTAFASGDSSNNPDANLNEVTTPIIGLINQVFNVLIPVVGAIGAVYCISLGIKFSRAEEPQEREKAKQHLKNAIIGFVIIFVLVVAMRIAVPNLTKWMNAASAGH
jgi:phosphotransferase system  glucose/maltose/N-acetylglucosamine-specific IIC component